MSRLSRHRSYRRLCKKLVRESLPNKGAGKWLASIFSNLTITNDETIISRTILHGN